MANKPDMELLRRELYEGRIYNLQLDISNLKAQKRSLLKKIERLNKSKEGLKYDVKKLNKKLSHNRYRLNKIYDLTEELEAIRDDSNRHLTNKKKEQLDYIIYDIRRYLSQVY